jgi:hypothetical protein
MEVVSMSLTTRQGIVDSAADLTVRLTRLLNAPGLSGKDHKKVEEELQAQKKFEKRLEKLLR